MIYCVFSVLGLAGAAAELCRAQLCAYTAAQHGSGRAGLFWALAHTSHGNCTHKCHTAFQCHVAQRFCIKIWQKKLLSSKEVVSEQPQKSKLNLFLSHLRVSVTK